MKMLPLMNSREVLIIIGTLYCPAEITTFPLPYFVVISPNDTKHTT